MDNKNNKEPSVITITLNKAIIIVATSILVSAGGAIWGTLAIANTIPFRVNAMEQQIGEMRQNFMPLDLSTEKWKNNDIQHSSIERKLDAIESKVDKLLIR